MRHRHPIAFVSLLLLSLPASARADMMTAQRSQDMLDGIGVNTHMAYTDTAYGDVDRVNRSLHYIGVHQVRNLLQSQSKDPAGHIHLDRLAATCDCRFDFTAKDPRIDVVIAWLDAFEAKFPGQILAVEGPNEVNHWPVDFNGVSGRDGAIAYQAALYKAVHADPKLAGVPVYSLTGVAGSSAQDVSDRVDDANEHPYARNGASPSHHLLKELVSSHQQTAPTRPMVVTETGYPTLVGHTDIKFGRDGVSQSVQARYLLDLLFDFRVAMIQKTFIYELLDEKPDPDGKAIERHYGLFEFDGTPKQAANGLHGLNAILADPGAEARHFAPKPVALQVSGVPADKTLLLEKSDGTYQLVLWAEPELWDVQDGREIPPPTRHVDVSFDRAIEGVRLDDPLTGPGRATVSDRHVALDLTDHPVVVSFRTTGGS